SAEAKGTTADRQEFGGELSGEIGITTGGKISLSGCNDGEGVKFQACFDGVTAKASLKGEVSEGSTKVSVSVEKSAKIFDESCSPPSGSGSVSGTQLLLPPELTPAQLAQLNGFSSVADMVAHFTGGPVPVPLDVGATTEDLAKAIYIGDKMNRIGNRRPIH